MDHSDDGGTVASRLRAENATLRSHIASLESQLAKERQEREEHDTQMEEYLQEVRQVHEYTVADLHAKSSELTKALEAYQERYDALNLQLQTVHELGDLSVVKLYNKVQNETVSDDTLQRLIKEDRRKELTLPQNLAGVLMGGKVERFFQLVVRPLRRLRVVNWLPPLELYQYYRKGKLSEDTFAFLIRKNPTTTLYLPKDMDLSSYNCSFSTFFQEVVSALPRLKTIEGPHHLVLSYLLYEDTQPERWETVLDEYFEEEKSLALSPEQIELLQENNACGFTFLLSVMTALPRVDVVLQDDSYICPQQWCGFTSEFISDFADEWNYIQWRRRENITPTERECAELWRNSGTSRTWCACKKCLSSAAKRNTVNSVFTVSAPLSEMFCPSATN